MEKETEWSITDLFPRFGEQQLELFRRECEESDRILLDSMFEIEDVVDHISDSEYVISTSLYCRPHDPGVTRIDPITVENLRTPHPGVRNGASWWETYLEPLIRDLVRVEAPWILRIHISSELSFLIPFLRHPRVEFHVMKHPSENTVPGMFWRYLPLEDGVNLVARGTDSLWPGHDYWRHAVETLKGPCRFYRRFFPADMDRVFIIYRSIPGPLVVREGLPLPYVDYVKAWIWFQMKNRWPRTACPPWIEAETPKFGMGHWAKYGQDEQFLSHWLYYIACEEGLYSVIDKRNRSKILDFDRRFVRSGSANSVIIEEP